MAVDALDALVHALDRVGEIATETARLAEDPVRMALAATARAGTTPSGEDWEPLHDGRAPLTAAGGAIKMVRSGPRLRATIGMPYVFHQHGAGGTSDTKAAKRHRARTAKAQAASGKKSKFHAPRRQILPEQGEPMPKGVREAVEDASKEAFERLTGPR